MMSELLGAQAAPPASAAAATDSRVVGQHDDYRDLHDLFPFGEGGKETGAHLSA